MTKEVIKTILVGNYLTVVGTYVKTLEDGRLVVLSDGQTFVGREVKCPTT